MSDYMMNHIIMLVYKRKRELEEFGNCQPISLQIAYYKSLSKVIANWVRSALGSVIHPKQTCAVSDRTISEKLVFFRDTIVYAQDSGVDACLISLEQETALLMSICDQFKLASGAKDETGLAAVERPSQTILYHLTFMEKFAKKNTFDHKSIRNWSAHGVHETLLEKESLDLLHGSLRRLSVSSGIDPIEGCRLAYSKVQDYMLRDAPKLGETATKAQSGKTTQVFLLKINGG
eukprot:g37267.t1